ncbi:MAG: TIGR02221 family CRISPR-associated protein [Phormidium sp. GEM2.Bin31]|nr:MAG: TIGR02221 family CRISPR-associated protein [Phormidium sp. GEM2.Bin31]
MKLLTFLGTGNYEQTTYTWEDQEVTTKYVAAAINEFFDIDTVQAFLTTEARDTHWMMFSKALKNAEEVFIPSGRSEEELWQIFEAVVNAVEPGETIVLDVTHSFRSIPLFVFLAGTYLQKSRNVKIGGVYYGAYERDRPRSPIFDLTPTLKFIDWLTATDKFLDTGSAKNLGQLLTNIQRDFYKQGRQKREPVSPRQLIGFGNRIQAISESIELVRPLKLMEETALLDKISYEDLQNDVGAFAQPFSLLLDKIQADYHQFALPNPREASPQKTLSKQVDLLAWYIDKSLSAQAILLGRELTVSVLCTALKFDYLGKTERQDVERGLNSLVAWREDTQQPRPLALEGLITMMPNLDLDWLSKFWSQLREVRNDLAHTEMRSDSLSAAKMSEFVKSNLLEEIKKLMTILP